MTFVDELAAASKAAFPRQQEKLLGMVETPAGELIGIWRSWAAFGGRGRLYERIGPEYWELEYRAADGDQFELVGRVVNGTKLAGCRHIEGCDWLAPKLRAFNTAAPGFTVGIVNQLTNMMRAHLHTLDPDETLRMLHAMNEAAV